MKTPKSKPYLSSVQILREGFDALCQRMGVADAIRFIRMFDVGRGSYTEEKGELLEGITPKEALAEALKVPAFPRRSRRGNRR